MVGFQGHVGGVQSLMINDLELVKRVLIDDFDHFDELEEVDVYEISRSRAWHGFDPVVTDVIVVETSILDGLQLR